MVSLTGTDEACYRSIHQLTVLEGMFALKHFSFHHHTQRLLHVPRWVGEVGGGGCVWEWGGGGKVLAVLRRKCEVT